MKIGQYKQMQSYLTRPDTKTPEERKIIEDKKAKAEVERKNKKRAEYGLKPIIDPKKFVELTNTYDGNNFVVDGDGNITDEASLKKKFEKEETKFLNSVYPKEASKEQVDYLEKNLNKMKQQQKPFKKVQKVSTPIEIDTTIPSVPPLSSVIQDQPKEVPEARSNVLVENDPKYRNTIFGSDTYWRRKRGL